MERRHPGQKPFCDDVLRRTLGQAGGLPGGKPPATFFKDVDEREAQAVEVLFTVRDRDHVGLAGQNCGIAVTPDTLVGMGEGFILEPLGAQRIEKRGFAVDTRVRVDVE